MSGADPSGLGGHKGVNPEWVAEADPGEWVGTE